MTNGSFEQLHWAPAACALPVADRPLRVAEFQAVFATSLRAITRLCPTRLRLRLAGGETLLAQLADLTARETECCAFFTFTLSQDDEAISLEVDVPAGHADVLDGLELSAAAAARLAG